MSILIAFRILSASIFPILLGFCVLVAIWAGVPVALFDSTRYLLGFAASLVASSICIISFSKSYMASGNWFFFTSLCLYVLAASGADSVSAAWSLYYLTTALVAFTVGSLGSKQTIIFGSTIFLSLVGYYVLLLLMHDPFFFTSSYPNAASVLVGENTIQIPRSTGFGRLCAIGTIILGYMFWYRAVRNEVRLYILSFAVVSFVFLLWSGARASILSFVLTLGLVMFFRGCGCLRISDFNISRKAVAAAMLLSVISSSFLVTLLYYETDLVHPRIWYNLTSGRNELWSLALTDIWHYWPQFNEHYGFSGFKSFYGENLSSGVLTAIHSAGIFGFLFVTIQAWIIWRMLSQREMFVEIGQCIGAALVLFFTFRSIFENGIYFFGVDSVLYFLSLGYMVKSEKFSDAFKPNNS